MHDRTHIRITTFCITSIASLLLLCPTPAEAGTVDPDYDISHGEVITLWNSWNLDTLNGGVAESLNAAPRYHSHLGCDGHSTIEGNWITGWDRQIDLVCQSAEFSDDDAVESLYASMGLGDTFIDTPQAKYWGPFMPNYYTSTLHLASMLNSQEYAEQQLFGDPEIRKIGWSNTTNLYEQRMLIPQCGPGNQAGCSAPITWTDTYVGVNDHDPTWADAIDNLFTYLDLGDHWNSAVYYIQMPWDDDNDATSYFRTGIAAGLQVLQAAGEEDPLTSIFTKLTADSAAWWDEAGIPGNEQAIYMRFAVPDTAELTSWATSTRRSRSADSMAMASPAARKASAMSGDLTWSNLRAYAHSSWRKSVPVSSAPSSL